MQVRIGETVYPVTKESAEGLFTDDWPGRLMRGPFTWAASVSGPRAADLVEVRLELILTVSTGTELDLYVQANQVYMAVANSPTITLEEDDGTVILSRPRSGMTGFNYNIIRHDSLQAMVTITMLVGPVTVNF